MRKLISTVAGFVGVVFLGVLVIAVQTSDAQQSTIGGATSRPKFQQVTIAPGASSVRALTVTGATNQWSTYVQASTTAGQSYGSVINAGTNNTDYAMRVMNAAGAVELMAVRGDGTVIVGQNQLPRWSYAQIDNNGAACTISTSQSRNITAGARGGAGNCAFSFTAAYTTAPPVCTATPLRTTAADITLSTMGTAGGVVRVYDAAGVATDNISALVSCVGT